MHIRKAILTGGGRATRLHPITTTINKHLLPLANKPMIFHAIEKVVEAGIKEIFINTNPGDTELEKYVGDGGHWGVRIQFFEQVGGPQGIAHVVHQARQFIGDDPFLFYLSDNVILGDIGTMVETFHAGNYDCMLALAEVPDPERFGVPVFDANKKLIDVIEKPAHPQNSYAVTGIYLYGPKVFFDAFEHIEKSPRGEYEISSIHSHFLKHGYKVGHTEITGWWKDTGKPSDLLNANTLLLDHLEEEDFPNHGAISPEAMIEGRVHIGLGTRVERGVRIIGPVIVGENCVLEQCTIGPYVTIGPGVSIRNATIERSIILDNATIDCGVHLSESLIGKKAEVRKKAVESHVRQRMIIGDKTVLEL